MSFVDKGKLLDDLLTRATRQAEGKAKQNKAQAEYDASHAAVKLPGVTATAGGIAKDDPDRTAGSWNQTVGSAKEFVGGFVGNEVCPCHTPRSNIRPSS